MKPLFAKPIIIHILPSYLLLGLLLAVTTCSSLILLSLPISIGIKLTVLLCILLSSAYYITRDALLLLPWSWHSVEVDIKGDLTLINKRQQYFKPQLAMTSFVHEYCVVLNLKRQGFKRVLHSVLLLDNVDDKNALRQLRVWLRLHKSKTSQQSNQYPS